MVDYAGETYIISHTAVDEDGVALTVGDVSAVTVQVLGTGNAVWVPEVPMSWSTVHKAWRYEWDTTTVPAGRYRAKVVIEGFDGSKNWEIKTIRLRPSPF